MIDNRTVYRDYPLPDAGNKMRSEDLPRFIEAFNSIDADLNTLFSDFAAKTYVDDAIADLIGGSGPALDTLNELAAALGNDANFASTVTTALAGKQPLATTLTNFAGLTIAAGYVPYGSGSDTFTTAASTSYGRSIWNVADEAAFKALVNIEAADILAALLTVDGSGSGLDADTLDGLNSTAFAQLSGTTAFSSAQTISTTGAGALLTLQSSDAGATGFGLDIFRNSATPAASDVLGQIRFQGKDSGGNTEIYSQIHSLITDPTNTSEGANLVLSTMVAGTLTAALTLGTTAAFSASSLTANGQTVWTAANDGSSSGLDADILRGTTPSTFGLSLIDDADAATALTTLGALAASSYTAADVLSKLLTVDGSGSGLDADTVDGWNIGTSGSAIPLLNAANTFSGNTTFSGRIISSLTTNGAPALSLSSSGVMFDVAAGRVGIARNAYYDETAAAYKVFANSGAGWAMIEAGAGNGPRFSSASGSVTAGTTITPTWNSIWHAGNDGASSGLDADLVRGVTPSAFILTLLDDANQAAAQATLGVLSSASYTAADVLAKLLTVDGTGSGLDADLLDGLSSASFAQLAGTTAFSAAQTISTAGTGALLTLTSSDAGATGHGIDIFRNSASPAASDVIGQIRFQGKDSAANTETYSQIHSVITDTTNASEDANLILSTMVAGTLTAALTLGTTAAFSASSLTANGQTVWTAANDGSSSGLDADILRGTTPSTFGLSLIDDADATTARSTLGLVIGTNVQAYNAALASIAGLTTAANKGIYTTASNTYATYDLSAFALTLLDDANAAAALTTLGALGSASYTAADVLAKLLTVDGSGSGLDADTVDGYNISTSGAAIPLLNATNTFSANTTFSSALRMGTVYATPSDSFATTNIWLPYGYMGTNGSFDTVLSSNAYRNNSASNTNLGANASTGWSMLQLLPNGDIKLRSEDSATGTYPTQVYGYTLSTTQHAFTGSVYVSSTLELGNATDTTIARASAGIISIEGNTNWQSNNDGSGSGLDADILRGTTPSAFGLSLIDDADASAARTTLGALASASYTAADVLAKLLTVDGSGSGIDADTLDGYNVGTSGATIPILSAVNTFSANTYVVSSGAASNFIVGASNNFASQIYQRANAGQSRWTRYETGTTLRWTIGANTAAESGTNSGSNYSLIAYDDAGASLGSAFDVTRSSRVVNFLVDPTVSGSTIWHAGNDGSGSGLDADILRGATPSAFFLTLVDDADAATARTTLGALAASSYTAADVLSKLLTVDGSGSSLDADLLDGKNTGTSGNVVGLLDGANTYSGASIFSSTVSFTNVPTISRANPILQFSETDAGTDEKMWEHHVNAALYQLRIVNDAYSAASTIFSVTRTAHTAATFNFGSAVTLQANGNTIWHAGNDGSGSGLDADLLDGKNTGTSGNVVGLLDGNNTYSGTSSFTGLTTISTTGTGSPLTITSTDAGATAFTVDIFRNSATPAASDVIASLRFLGKNSGATTFQYARIQTIITDPTAASEDASLYFTNTIAGTSTDALILGTTAAFSMSSITAAGSTVWHAGNDGSSSGLDADILRGTTPSTFGLSLIDDADAATARTTLGLVIGTNVQAYNAALASIAGLTTSADKGIYTTASNTYATYDLSAFGRSLIDDADAATALTTLGALASASYTAADILSKLLTVDGSGSGIDADLLDGISSAAFAQLAAANTFTDNTTILKSGASSNFTVGGNTAFSASILIRSNAGQQRNLSWTTAGVSRWIMFADTTAESGSNAGSNFSFRAYDDAGTSLGDVFAVTRSTRVVNFLVGPTVSGSTIWHAGNDGSGSGLDADLIQSVAPSAFFLTLVDDTSASAARTTLGLGTSATVNTGTSGAVIPLLSTSNTWGASARQSFTLADMFDPSTTRTGNVRFGRNTTQYMSMFGGANGNIFEATSGDAAQKNFSIYNTTETLSTSWVFGYDGTLKHNGTNLFWHAGNDGAGSGLDADLLDGNNIGTSGTAIPLLSTANTWSTTQTFTVAPVFTAASGTRTALGLGTSATVNTGTSGAVIPLLNGNNTYSGTSSFTGAMTVSTTGTGSPITVTSTDAGASAFTFDLFRNSASPAASDAIAAIRFQGKNASATTIAYSQIQSIITDTTAASEDATLYLSTYVAGSLVNALSLGTIAQFAFPTNTEVHAVGTSGYGAFYARGSGTNSAYLFLGNVTSGERGRLYSDDARNFVISNDSGVSNHFLMSSTGAITATSSMTATNFTATSDKRMKDNIVDFFEAAQKLRQLRPVTFDWKKDGVAAIGFVAQEIETVLPQVVLTGHDGMKSVNYGAITAALTGGWQEHDSRIAALEARIAQLEARAA